MENKIQINLGTDHTLECTEKIIGRSGEGLVSRLEITVPEALTDYDAYIDFEKPNGEVLRTPKLEVKYGVAYYDVPQYLLFESGEIKVQLVFIKGKIIWKSSKKRYTILKSINASDDIPDKEDFIAQAQAVLDALSGEVQEIADTLANDAKFTNTIIEACGRQTKITTINGKTLRFFADTQEEYDKLSEAQKQNLFAIITDDTTREAIFGELEEHRQNLAEADRKITELEGKMGTSGSLKMLDFPEQDDEGQPIIYPIGTLLTLQVNMSVYTGDEPPAVYVHSNLYTGLMMKEIRTEYVELAEQVTDTSNYAPLEGTWRAIGLSGKHIPNDQMPIQYNYYLIYRVM